MSFSNVSSSLSVITDNTWSGCAEIDYTNSARANGSTFDLAVDSPGTFYGRVSQLAFDDLYPSQNNDENLYSFWRMFRPKGVQDVIANDLDMTWVSPYWTFSIPFGSKTGWYSAMYWMKDNGTFCLWDGVRLGEPAETFYVSREAYPAALRAG